jgi:predicted branched-subunit amino acid permease
MPAPEGARPLTDLGNGFRAGLGVVPTFGFMFLGYGLAAAVAGMPPAAALAITVAVFAAPAQFAMADVAAQGGGIIQLVGIAVVVNLRFFVMSLTLAGTFGGERRLSQLLWSQFVSATTFLTTFFHWRGGRAREPLSFFQGVVLAAVPAALLGTAAGLWIGGEVSEVVAFAASLFLPVYFTLLLAGDTQGRRELTAAALGFALTPPAELLLPGWGLFAVALGVGVGLYATSPEDAERE